MKIPMANFKLLLDTFKLNLKLHLNVLVLKILSITKLYFIVKTQY